MELYSLMNYQNLTQNLFCATHFLPLVVESFPQASNFAVQIEALGRDYPPHPRALADSL
jgi:hypothetical protein